MLFMEIHNLNMVKYCLKILLIIFLFFFALNIQPSAAQETMEELGPSESSELKTPPIPPPSPEIEQLEELRPEEAVRPPIGVSQEVVSTLQTELQKINTKINYLILVIGGEFLLILILAINIYILYKRLKKP